MYICTECRHESRTRLARCPRCKAYDSMMREHNFILKCEQDELARRNQMDAFGLIINGFLVLVYGVFFFLGTFALQCWLLRFLRIFSMQATTLFLVGLFLGLTVTGWYLQSRPCIRWRKHQYHAIIGPVLGGLANIVIWIGIFLFEVVLRR